MSPIYSSVRKNDSIRRVGILFAGGPAPAANAVISTAAAAFLRNGIHVTGILNGYSNLVNYRPENPLQVGVHYRNLDAQALKRTRNSQGIMIGTAQQPRQRRAFARALG